MRLRLRITEPDTSPAWGGKETPQVPHAYSRLKQGLGLLRQHFALFLNGASMSSMSQEKPLVRSEIWEELRDCSGIRFTSDPKDNISLGPTRKSPDGNQAVRGSGS